MQSKENFNDFNIYICSTNPLWFISDVIMAMIEVTAKLPGRSVFLAGEVVECSVIFKNVGVKHQNPSSPSRRSAIKLAWASAQVHCQCTVSDNKVMLPKPTVLSNADVTTTGNETSFLPSKGIEMLIYSSFFFNLIPSYRTACCAAT